MGLLFNFTRLINKYKSKFAAITLSCGYYDDSGDFVKEENEAVLLEGAIISFKESKIYRSDGTLTSNDKRLFTNSPIDSKLHGAKIAYGDRVYSIVDCTENAKFTGVYAYTLKYVSAFKDAYPDYYLTDMIWKLEQRLDGVLVEGEEPEPSESITDSSNHLEERLDGVLE